MTADMEGLGKEYYKSGKIETVTTYKNGKREGPQKGYYENGALKYEAFVTKGRFFEGPFKFYYESGRMMEESHFKDYEKEGQKKVYRENGKLCVTIEYIKNSPVNGLCHHSDGTTRALTDEELRQFNYFRYKEIGCDRVIECN